MDKNTYNLKKLDRLFILYAYLLQGKEGAYYWHYSLDYEVLKKDVQNGQDY